MRNLTLMEARAAKRAHDAEFRQHRLTCPDCTRKKLCYVAIVMQDTLRAEADELAHWHDPGPDQGVLL